MPYSQEIIEHFEKPKNIGSFKNTISSIVSNPGCVMKMQVIIKDELIDDVRVQVYGNPAAIACLSFLGQLIKKMNIKEAQKIDAKLLQEKLNLNAMQHYYAILAIDCLQGVFHEK